MGGAGKVVFESIAIDLEVFLSQFRVDINQFPDPEDIYSLLRHFDLLAANSHLDVEAMLLDPSGRAFTLEPMFLRVLVRGDVSLYSYKEHLFVSREHLPLYLLRQTFNEFHQEDEMYDNPVTYIKVQNEYLGVLLFITNDCPDMREKILKLPFSAKRIQNVIIDYNRCVGHTYAANKGLQGRFRLVSGLGLGLCSAQYGMQPTGQIYSASGYQSTSSVFVSPYFLLELSHREKWRNTAFVTGFHYYAHTMEPITIARVVPEGLARQFVRFTFSFERVRIPFMLKHYRKVGNYFVFLQGGLWLNIDMGERHKWERIFENQDSDARLVSVQLLFHENRDFVLGFGGGAGLERTINPMLRLFVSAHMDTSRNYFTYRNGFQFENILNLEDFGRLNNFSLHMGLKWSFWN